MQTRQTPTETCPTLGYDVFIKGNLIPLKSKKQDVVARYRVEPEYQAMTLVAQELIQLKHIF